MFLIGRSSKISLLSCQFIHLKRMRRSTPPSKSKTTSTKSRKRLKIQDDEDGGETAESSGAGPANWRDVYANIVEMRADKSAPVDTMGCEKNHDLKAPPKVRCRFEFNLQGGPSASGKKHVDIKFKLPLTA